MFQSSKIIERFSYVSLDCRLPRRSVPPASVTWSGPQMGNAGVGVTLDGRLIFSNYSPVIQSLGETYTCTVTNTISKQTKVSERYSLRDVPGEEGITHHHTFIPLITHSLPPSLSLPHSITHSLSPHMFTYLSIYPSISIYLSIHIYI